MLTETQLKILGDRAKRLSKRHGVPISPTAKGLGVFTHGPLSLVEYLLHEVAHWRVLGNDLQRLPRRLTAWVAHNTDGMSKHLADSAEIDTALITFLAGFQLGLWDDALPFARSCQSNLQGSFNFFDTSAQHVRREFETRRNAKGIERMSQELALWLRPTAKRSLRPFNGQFVT